jgi:hypothetical protein
MTMTLSFNLSMAAAIFAAAPATSAQSGTIPGAQNSTQQTADVRTYRHCHNTPRRTYCHTREHLPITVRPHLPVPKDPQRD